MNQQELSSQLNAKHADFIQTIASLDEHAFMQAPAGKWTAGQQLDHILRAVKPVTLAFRLPRFVPRFLFGKPNRPGRSYEALVEKYKQKLQQGGRASGRFVPGPVPFAHREKLSKALQASISSLCRIVEGMNETELDAYILPHPLLGKLTLREMLYFTIYHVQHHQEIMLRNLNGISG